MAEGTSEVQEQVPGGEVAAAAKAVRNPNCVFCRIIAKESPATILYEDEDYICFSDHRPAATHHYLIVPKNHIKDPKSLQQEHIPLIERMVEIGKKILSEQGGNVDEARIGFHWPPFIFVKHLHLHVVSPESSMGWFSRNILYRVDSFAFVSHTWMVDHLHTVQSN